MNRILQLFAVSALLLVTLPAAAGPATISDTLTVFQNSAQFPASVTEPDGGTPFIFISAFGPTGDPTRFGNYTVLTHPDGTISDVFGVIPASGVNDSAFGITGIIPVVFRIRV